MTAAGWSPLAGAQEAVCPVLRGLHGLSPRSPPQSGSFSCETRVCSVGSPVPFPSPAQAARWRPQPGSDSGSFPTLRGFPVGRCVAAAAGSVSLAPAPLSHTAPRPGGTALPRARSLLRREQAGGGPCGAFRSAAARLVLPGPRAPPRQGLRAAFCPAHSRRWEESFPGAADSRNSHQVPTAQCPQSASPALPRAGTAPSARDVLR
ncbi:translation initiation factor IF-2-like [Neovison vison]|uniref:translation initiation factor IF-2-like n=1 Tax=Neovison vison TaxID=452646 RepID=UPI001CF074A3|nr:translation initiation factor IF-2-like [Neogale vison]